MHYLHHQLQTVTHARTKTIKLITTITGILQMTNSQIQTCEQPIDLTLW